MRKFLRDEGGASAVELAILAPVFLAFVVGVIQCGFLIFTQASLHYAVQKAVRCTALQSTCLSEASHYYGFGKTLKFEPSEKTCGLALTATVTYTLSVILYRKDIELAATSCFPDIKKVTS